MVPSSQLFAFPPFYHTPPLLSTFLLWESKSSFLDCFLLYTLRRLHNENGKIHHSTKYRRLLKLISFFIFEYWVLDWIMGENMLLYVNV